MSVYYQYNPDGSVTGYTIRPAPYSASLHSYATFTGVHSTLIYPASSYRTWSGSHENSVSFATCDRPATSEGNPAERWDEDEGGVSERDGQSVWHSGHTVSEPDCMSPAEKHCRSFRAYPDIETVRAGRDIHSLLSWIQPERLRNAPYGPVLDIVEHETGAVFARKVSKKMLILFCGRHAISKFLKTLERKDNENWKGPPTVQQLILPRGIATHIGIKIMLAWMCRACHWDRSIPFASVHVPRNLFAAIGLARTFDVFSLHPDARRVDEFIAANHMKRPVYVDELKSIWKCLPRDCQYTYQIIGALSNRLARYENGDVNALPGGEEILAYIEEDTDLKARVRDTKVNAQFKPVFGTEWCKRLAEKSPSLLEGPVGAQKKAKVLRILC